MKESDVILTRARELILRPDGWCQGKFARVKPGHEGFTFSNREFKDYANEYAEARSFCALGAINHATCEIEDVNSYAAQEAAGRLRDAVKANIAHWNDHLCSTAEEVAAGFTLALENKDDN